MNYSDIFVHTLYIYTWVLIPVYLVYGVVQFFYEDYSHIFLILLYMIIRRIFPAKKWISYQKFMTNMKPSNYYNNCNIINLPPIKEKTMICYHPHGIFCGGFSWNGAFHQNLSKSEITWLVTPILFMLPIFSDLITWMGFESVSKKNMTKLMKQKKKIALLPGGFHEVAILEYNVETVYIPFGFIKMALRNGYTIIPTYTFGESKAYSTIKLPYFLQKWLIKLKLPAVIFWGKFLMYPYNDIKLETYFGKPIDCPLTENPSTKLIHKFRNIYIEEMKMIGKKNNVNIKIKSEF